MNFRYVKRFTGTKRTPRFVTVLQYCPDLCVTWVDMPDPKSAEWETFQDEESYKKAKKSEDARKANNWGER